MPQPRLEHYYEINRRMGRITALGATAIWLAMAAAVWGNSTYVTIVLVGQVVTVGFNVCADRYLLARFGPRLELARMLFNSMSTVVICCLVGWPAPAWLWPPFVALAFDPSGGVYAIAVVGLTLTIQCVASLVDGVPWTFPLAAIVITVYAWAISDNRVRVIRDMLVRSDEQRAEIERAHEQLKTEIAARERVEVELRAAQKLEALGRIASGVAHEINTPIQFVGDSINFLQEGVADVMALCRLNASVRAETDDARRVEAIAAADAAEEAADLTYLAEHVPQALDRARDGVARVAAIVRSMKQFVHGGAETAVATDLEQAIQSTLTIASHEYKLVADVETELGGIPPVPCQAGEINQVLLNLIVNAAHAVADTGRRGTIRIATRRDRDDVIVTVADTGTGIPETVRDRMFEPFFTTKSVGRGTGQGLALARAIVERHRGRLTYETVVGRGTTFIIRLPVRAATQPLLLAG